MTQQELDFGKPIFNYNDKFIRKWFNRTFSDDTQFPLIFIFSEKHENRYYLCNSHEEIFSMFFHILNQRFEEEHWYYNDEDGKLYDKDEAEAIVKAGDALWALDFLERHRDHEYQGYIWTNPEAFSL